MRIAVLNSKGGCGKTTVATNLAALLAGQHGTCVLTDCDAQGSSTFWLAQRDATRPPIVGLEAYRNVPCNVTRSWQQRLPTGTQYCVADAPAGVDQFALPKFVAHADVILVPVAPSPVDIHAATRFIEQLLIVGKVRQRGVRVGVIANRVRLEASAYQHLQRFLTVLDLPLVAQFRDSTLYLEAADRGLGVVELDQPEADHERREWQRLAQWIEQTASASAALTRDPAPAAGSSPIAALAAGS